MLSLSSSKSYFVQDRFFLCSLVSVLALNVLTVMLTWLVVFRWNAGFEYNPNSFWQLSTYGPIGTLIVSQLMFIGVFVFVKSGLSYISKQRLKQLESSMGPGSQEHIEGKLFQIKKKYRQLTSIVISAILLIVTLDALNDVSNVLLLFHIL